MNNSIKIALYFILITSAAGFGYLFYQSYSNLMNESAQNRDSELLDSRVPHIGKGLTHSESERPLGIYGGAFFISVVLFGLLFARDVSHYIAHRFTTAVYDEDASPATDPAYEQAEEEWANGNHLEAIRLMRGYLERYPQRQYVALRIAEIYEKDLRNYLAAALEYEEVLKQKLPAERWGWAAIHLCNLYNKLNHTDKALALLRRIDAEYGQTAAAEKARKRLALIEEGAADEPSEEQPPVKQEETS